MNAAIRPAHPADAPGVAQVHVQSWQETYAGLISPALLDRMTNAAALERRAASWTQALESPHPDRPVYVAAQRGEVLAFASGGPAPAHPGFDAEVYTLYSLRRVQGRGVGRALLRALARDLHAGGASNLALWVLSRNPTRAWYARQGAREAGTKQEGELHETRMVWDDLGVLLT